MTLIHRPNGVHAPDVNAIAPPTPWPGRQPREIWAGFSEETISVYQAYNPKIAEAAVRAQTLDVGGFKLERTTWIKPSFTWMLYRSGCATKEGQERILRIDVARSTFDKLVTSAASSLSTNSRSAPVVIQWDPERDLALERMPDLRSLQVGIKPGAVALYLEGIAKIVDVTALASRFGAETDVHARKTMMPEETRYPLALPPALLGGHGPKSTQTETLAPARAPDEKHEAAEAAARPWDLLTRGSR